MKKVLSGVFCLILTFNSCTVVDTELLDLVLEIKNQNLELLKEVRTLQDEVKALREKSDSLINELKFSAFREEELLNKVTSLQNELAEVLNQIGILTEKLDNQSSDLETVKAELADLQEKYLDILEQLEKLQELSQILGEIEALKGQLSDLDDKYQVILGSLAKSNEELLVLKNQIEGLKSQLAENLEKIRELTSLLDDEGANIENILSQIEDLKASIAELKSLLENQLEGKSPIPTNGLVGWWPFNGSAIDESVNGRNGIVNGASLTEDRFGEKDKAYSFNGETNYITYGQYNDPIISDSSLTISLWVNSVYNNPEMVVVGCRGRGPTAFVIQQGIQLTCTFADSNGGFHNLDTYSINIKDGNWHHIVMIYSGEKKSIYIDNLLIDEVVEDFNLYVNGLLEFGRDFPYGRYYKGKLDDVSIWNRALTKDEISRIFKGEGF